MTYHEHQPPRSLGEIEADIHKLQEKSIVPRNVTPGEGRGDEGEGATHFGSALHLSASEEATA